MRDTQPQWHTLRTTYFSNKKKLGTSFSHL
jgi:hypothetical protein